MTTEKIKEKLNLLRLYLTGTMASLFASIVWLVQNFGKADILNIKLAAFSMLAFLVFIFIIESRIRKLINLL